ncbi:MAG: hypothetical protein WDZ28_03145 [Simkaniaceae bacterium]
MKKIDQLIEEVGQANAPPKKPMGGIPKQRLPKPLRFIFNITLLPFLHLDLFMQKIAKKIIRPPYIRVGACKKRGNCCHYILIKKQKGYLGRLFLLWHLEVNGFYKRFDETIPQEKGEFFVMGCRYLNKKGECTNYRFRPMVCRKWPVIEHFGRPQIIKGCGYSYVHRKKNKID